MKIKYVFIGLLSFCIVFVVGICDLIDVGHGYKGSMTSEGIYDTRTNREYGQPYNIEKYFVDKYNETVTFYEDKTLRVYIENVENFNQKKLNDYINSKKGIVDQFQKIDGTCTIVACLGLVNYYGNVLGEAEITDSNEDMFVNIWDACKKKGYTTKNSGTENGMVNNCVSKAFDIYDVSRHGNTEWYYLLKKTRKSIDNGQPILFDLIDHSTVAIGYTTFNYSYEKKEKYGFLNKKIRNVTKTGTESFIILNDGCRFDESGYESYFPTSNIGNIRDGMQVCLTPSD